jgi:hypothetical protein
VKRATAGQPARLSYQLGLLRQDFAKGPLRPIRCQVDRTHPSSLPIDRRAVTDRDRAVSGMIGAGAQL